MSTNEATALAAGIRASDGCPIVFMEALAKQVLASPDPEHLIGVHRVVYLDTQNGKRTTSFMAVGAAPDGSFGSQIRSYVFFPYLLAKDLRTEATCDDPWGALNGTEPFPPTPVSGARPLSPKQEPDYLTPEREALVRKMAAEHGG